MQHPLENATASLVTTSRLSHWIDTFASLSEAGRGVTRLAYSPLERRSHAVFGEYMASLGLTVETDAAGNTIAELASTTGEREAAIGTGSHLDSVPEGGRFDGIAGVVAGMEVARIAVEQQLPRRRPWRFVAFASEEGARFGQACNGSRMIAGLTTSADLDGFHDKDGVSMAAAMKSVGLAPDAVETARWRSEDWFAFVEVHIEQGGVLESKNLSVGVVDVISGSTRLEVTVLGQASHTGGTPMHLRRDALVTAAECVLACQTIATDPEHHGTRVTVGRLDVHPGSITTIPGRVVFTVDVRDVDSDRQRLTAEDLVARFEQIARSRRTQLTVALIGDTSPVVLPSWVAEHIAAGAAEEGLSYRMLPSGASHDSQQINRVVPTGMVFVPSRDGLSHVPEEFTEASELADGTAVLLQAMKRLDAAS
ncbi:allantoate deiminase/N-carbamoyl-L-amino-acid hydrolase [Homoserinimonas aerilata]|uniref:Allantoate deiminase/N-carbamoyl-L-amino-acid hydrolase n=1 Tax=Homoserinimonas aerilata TaxID=1162970 RepID=A0A542YAE2_9MICO|nr:Zn-dependent hydrolase [Homoserinimonas aerilata]TQL44934.1 allantoate deiminase/N-carbamoyl-L-amino-acid hydrolase [Homoserinimonas aerilata]